MDIRKWFQVPSSVTTQGAEGKTNAETNVLDFDMRSEHANSSHANSEVHGGGNATGKDSSLDNSGHLQQVPNDLGIEKPNQVALHQYPVRLFQGKNRAFVASWYHNREWLEYSVHADAAFCYPCRKFGGARATDSTFTHKGYRDWKHATEREKGFHKHSTSKEHISCMTLWLEHGRRIKNNSEISTLLNAEQLRKNRYYVSALIDVVGFLAENQLPLRGNADAFDDMAEGGSGLFLSLLDYTIKKDSELAEIVKTIPRNATYTSPDIQNELISTLSNVVTEAIVEEVGESWYTIKVDGTRDPTGCENISVVLRFVSELYEATERLLTVATVSAGDAKTLTDTIITELTKAGLSTSKILSQVYDGASLMSGKHGGVQKLLQEKLGREIPYVHCLNHQLHLVVVHALTAEKAITDFFDICNTMYKFFRKPSVAAQYKGERLKRLLDQRWTGHFATVSAIIASYQDITSFLSEIESDRAYCSEIRMEAIGLLREISETNFMFIARLVQKLLKLLDPPNKLLQGEDMDLLTGLELVACSTECVRKLRCDTEFADLWRAVTDSNALVTPTKRRRTFSKNMSQYLVEGTTAQKDTDETELRRLFYSAIDNVLGELNQRFNERNTKLARALAAFDPKTDNFLDINLVKHITDLAGSTTVEEEFVVAKTFFQTQMEREKETKWTLKRPLQNHKKTLEAMPSVLIAMKLALTFGASTAMCENSFSVLKNVFTDHRRSMHHIRKAQLVQLAFERDLTRKCTNEWKEKVLRRFCSDSRRLQLF
ncbi:zinc finger MYM-type protein 1-like [Astyanax mexicanus]|uniref:Zinc finger MYM-type protein 1-like n=1 Tax=Astyanax mexicanus TaxID=7994 RepID=A0A8T2MG21_ASTMX|nr:zinc finger MYM-type protein 1-like [Astyanax mexicanus]